MAHYYDTEIEAQDKFSNKIFRILCSAFIFSVFYMLSIAVYHFVVGSFCNYFHLRSSYNFNGFIELETDYQYWSLPRITAIFLSGPLACLFIGIYFIYKFSKMSGNVSIIRYYCLWGGIVFVNFFLIQLVSSPFGAANYKGALYQGLSVVFAWWRFKGTMLAPVAVLTAVGLFYFGYFSSNDFYKFSFSKKMNVVKKGRNRFLLEVYVIPIVIAAPFLWFLSNSFSFILNIFLYIGFLIIGIGMVFRNEYYVRSQRASKADVVNRIPILEGIAALAVWWLIYLFWT